ncbi:hypothetical protein HMH01_01675 [Halovulum dunhuangense]|uniref:Uncharacterized protein n=1 Tax=Halovulum dunhuangense TaxID=1505036 RepID=A0A849KYD7_9RHOB|nr:hypothetical protein [Halovulum dunhuangense]
MTDRSRIRGGAPVGQVSQLDAVETGAVYALRLWFDGPEAQAEVWNSFASTLGPKAGRTALQALEQLFEILVRHGRRPLMRHDVACKCLGADEAFFATLIATAADGDREEAAMIASTLVRADMALFVAEPAQVFGLALKRLGMGTPQPAPGHVSAQVLH